MSAPALVIFDCDGVLVDSEPVNLRVLLEDAAAFGIHCDLGEAVRRYRGWRIADCVAELEAQSGRRLPEDFLPRWRARAAEVFRRELRPVEGIHEALARIAAPVCVASNGPRDKMEVTLEVTGLLPRFAGRIFSAYELGRWKPDPGIYLAAAAAFDLAPAHCTVVEDSAPGVQAGRAAGMRVLGFAPDGDGAELAAAGAEVFHRMLDLPALLAPPP